MSTGFPLIVCFIPLLLAEVVLFAEFKKAFLLKMQAAVLLGLLVLIPVTFLQTLFLNFTPQAAGAPQNIFHILIYAIFVNGFIEETCKTGILFALPLNKTVQKAFFSLSILTGLSFGCFESVIYLIKSGQFVPARLITAVLLHGICSGIESFTVLKIRLARNTALSPKLYTFSSYIQAVVLHGLYNFFSVLPGAFRVFPLLCIAAGAYKNYTLLQKKE